jgi:hypothetical protein
MNTYPSQLLPKSKLTEAWSEFFDSLRSEHELFAVTVVFRPVDQNNSQARWEGEYKEGVLRRFQRALDGNKSVQEGTSFAYPDFFYFERNEASVFRVTGSRKPFHIHALLPIRKSQVYRIWSIDNSDLKERLKTDIFSLGTVQSILVEPVRVGHTLDWTRYITKLKAV